MSKEKERKIETYGDLTDEELEEGIRDANAEKGKRLAAEAAKRADLPYAACTGCGRTFTRAEHGRYAVCPDCGEREAVILKGAAD